MSCSVLRAGLLAAALSSCGEETDHPPIVWEGDHLRFGTDEELTNICGGTLPYADGLVAYLGGVFAVADPRVDFYWVPDGLRDDCSEHAIGCSVGHNVFSREPFHQHELVHATRGSRVAFPPLEEGLAELFGDDWDPTYPVAGDIEALWETHDRGAKIGGAWYPVAGYFASFLRSEYGAESLLSLAERSRHEDTWEHTQTIFQNVYDDTFQSTLEEYDDYPVCDQSWYRDNGFDCDHVDGTLPSAERLELRVPMDCNDPTVIGPRRGERWATLTFEVPTTREYDFGVAKIGGSKPGRLHVRRCDQDCRDVEDGGFTGNVETQPVAEYGGEGLLTCIDSGRITLRFAVDADDDGEFVVGFSPGAEVTGPCAPM